MYLDRWTARSGEPAYPKAICLALVDAVDAALRSAAEIDRRAARLLSVAPKVRTMNTYGAPVPEGIA
ncbi:hypothetical protein BA011_33590 (plasmid) [Rhizobium leguminosarum]|uniref:Uncharacterized protein n=1 Tax=Rhizobium leguminosarum TaxID=384 RepID=A0A179BCG9_RHILE|nr:hypothetical protein BA011_33590 [Rhizobium leguminosarum]OAP89396.1 hypothetical protein A4U53_32765 [Rhizobium leguminosarum]